MGTGVTFSGLGSGIDTAKIIETLVYSERAPIRQMESQKKAYNSELTTNRSLNSKLQSLQTTMEGMSTIGEFLSYSAESTDEDAVKVTVTGEATPGTYDIQVTQLAQAERSYSKAFNDDVAGVAGTGDFTISVGVSDPEDTVITIDAGDTLSSIVEKINSSDANVTASLLFTGSEYQIQITGKETGADNAISFGETGTLDFQMTEYLVAQDATVEIDGIEITSESNTVSDALTGFALELTEVQTEKSQVVVSPDTEKIEENIQSFVDKYNDIMGIIKSDQTSSSTFRSLQMQLSTMIANQLGSGLGGTFTALSQIGISTQSDGTLSLDSEDLEEAVASDTVGVAKLFTGTDDNSVDGIGDLLDDLIESYISSVDGILTAKESGINDAIRGLDSSILQAEDRISTYESGLRMQFTKMELLMNDLNSQGSFMSSQRFMW